MRNSHNTTLQIGYQVVLYLARVKLRLRVGLVGYAALWCKLRPRHRLVPYPAFQAVRQTVRIVGMDHPQGVLRTGDRATVKFEFISHPEFIKVGMKLLFREGKTKVSDMSASH